MSLILDALRKLEREKGAPEERGFVVLGSGGGGGRRPAGRAAAVALAAVAVGALGAVAWQRLGAPEPERAPEATPAPTLEAVRSPRPAAAPGDPGEDVRAQPVPPEEPAPASGPATLEPPAPTPTPSFRLQAITRRDGRPVALLNDRLVREGDSFDGVRVVRIGEMEVELETPSGSVILSF